MLHILIKLESENIVINCLGLSVEFAVEVFRIILLEEKDTTLLSTVLKKAGIESRLMVSWLMLHVKTIKFLFY